MEKQACTAGLACFLQHAQLHLTALFSRQPKTLKPHFPSHLTALLSLKNISPKTLQAM
jgi:hypothetical protein